MIRSVNDGTAPQEHGERSRAIIDHAAPAASQLIGDGAAWGMLTSVDLQECDPTAIRSRERIRQYVVELCELIGMRRFGECQVVHFGEGRVAGFSMTQLIETSLISGHFANDSNRAYLDIFSCKRYDPGMVEEFSKRFFRASRSLTTTTLRQ
jgi:S-adenosylmethionine/arginine decarboxylase-like enzyme